jgi:PAS domain S-box-containing protein
MPDPGWAGRAFPVLLAAAVCLPLLVLLASAVLSWRETWRQARVDTLHTADAAAEYIGRVLDGQRMLVQRVDDMLRGRSDADIRRDERALHEELRRMLQGLPGEVTSFVLDASGQALVTGNLFPAPTGSFADREFYRALSAPGAPATHVSRVFIRRVNSTTVFTVGQRRSAAGNGQPAGGFDGLVVLTVVTRELSAGLLNLLSGSDDNIGVARQDGEVLAGTRGFSRPPPPLADGPVRRAMAQGVARSVLMVPGEAERPERLVGLRQVAGWPVYALASRPRANVVRDWYAQMMPQLAVGLPATALLALLAALMWRQQEALGQAYRGLEARVAERTAALAASEAEFRATFDASVIGKAQAELGSLRFVRVNQLFCDITGFSADELTHGMGMLDLLLPEWGEVAPEQRLETLMRDGTHHAEERFRHKDGHAIWAHVSIGLIRDDAGRPVRAIAAVQDITERKLAEERQALLAREVDHRGKNALAVVQAALRLTPKHDAAAYATAIEGRVAALARAHTMLARARWRGTELYALVAGELATFLVGGAGGPQARLDGPAVSVPAALTQPLSMALHELATNAVKHGALSRRGGALSVTWSVVATVLTLDWWEQGGPPTGGPPAQRGFGSRLLQATVGHQLGGRLVLEWLPAGLHCQMQVPLARPGTLEPEEG